MFKLIEKIKLGPHIYQATFYAPAIAARAQAGQFVMVRVTLTGERIPLTIADYDRKQGTLTLVFQVLGKTTRYLEELLVGDSIPDLLGPQGNPTDVSYYGHTLVIGGGIGIAPSFTIARALKTAGNNVSTIVGFRSKDHVFWEEKIQAVSDNLYICTNDGSYGRQGFVTTVLAEMMASDTQIDRIFCIGPAVMMKAVAEATRERKITTIVSLNALMVCGMGMCGACRISYDNATRFSCMDGPDLDGHKVNFDELIKRLETYKAEECTCG